MATLLKWYKCFIVFVMWIGEGGIKPVEHRMQNATILLSVRNSPFSRPSLDRSLSNPTLAMVAMSGEKLVWGSSVLSAYPRADSEKV